MEKFTWISMHSITTRQNLAPLGSAGKTFERKIYLTVTIDTECDKGAGWAVQHPLRFRGVVEAIAKVLQPMFTRFAVRPTYLLSPEVMRDRASVLVLQRAMDQGAELGTHLHGEFIEPLNLAMPSHTLEIQRHYTAKVEAKKLANLTDLFIRQFNTHPRSFRAGRFGIGVNTLEILQSLDYLVDSSVAPYSQWGRDIHFWGVPLQPYRPSLKDYRRRGTASILEIPVSIGGSWYDYMPEFLLKSKPKLPYVWGSLKKYLFKSRLTPVWLRPTFSTLDEMWRLSQNIIRRHAQGPVLLNMMFHNVEFVPGCSPAASTAGQVNRFAERLTGYFSLCARERIESITLAQAAELF